MRNIRDITFDGRRTAKAAGIIVIAALSCVAIAIFGRAYTYDDPMAYRIRALWDSAGASDHAYQQAWGLTFMGAQLEAIKPWLVLIDDQDEVKKIVDYHEAKDRHIARFRLHYPLASDLAAQGDFAAGNRQLLATWIDGQTATPGAETALASYPYDVAIVNGVTYDIDIVAQWSDVVDSTHANIGIIKTYCNDYNTEMLRLVATSDTELPNTPSEGTE